MKAAIRTQYGSPQVIKIKEINQPEPNDDGILIKIHAATVNRTDCANLTAKPFIMRFVLGFFKPKKIILGTDFAGEVISVGKNCNSIKIGERLFGFKDTGAESQAEYVVTKSENVFYIPQNIDYKQAAASLEGAHYAYTYIRETDIKPGQRVLINGASGAIGSALLQFVREYDVHITATCTSENQELIRSLGADKIVCYDKEDFTLQNEIYDFIFDCVGKSTFGKCKSKIRKNGVYISSELGPFAQNMIYPLFNFFRTKKVIFPIPYKKEESIPYIIERLKKGQFIPLIDREYDLDDISDAYDYVQRGKKTGNVIVNITHNRG